MSVSPQATEIGVTSNRKFHSIDPGKLTMAPYFACLRTQSYKNIDVLISVDGADQASAKLPSRLCNRIASTHCTTRLRDQQEHPRNQRTEANSLQRAFALRCEPTLRHLRTVAVSCAPLRYAQPRGLGLKVSDEFTVPLCATHHHHLHDTTKEREWWQERKIDPLIIASGRESRRHSRDSAQPAEEGSIHSLSEKSSKP